MSGKKKTEAKPKAKVEEATPETRKGYTPKKELPTPTRKKAEAANRQPIVANRKAMTRQERRQKRRERSAANTARWNKEQEAMRTGDERNMPPQHAGPVRRFGRDVIDSRFSPGSYFMPVALLLLFGLFIERFSPHLFVGFTIFVYVVFFVMAVWTGRNVRRTRVLAEHKFGADRVPRGFSLQMFSRAFYPKRWRMPRPQVASGDIPAGARDFDYKEAKAARKKG